jgi:hypothetical protein
MLQGNVTIFSSVFENDHQYVHLPLAHVSNSSYLFFSSTSGSSSSSDFPELSKAPKLTYIQQYSVKLHTDIQ